MLVGDIYVSCSVVLPKLCHLLLVMEESEDDPGYICCNNSQSISEESRSCWSYFTKRCKSIVLEHKHSASDGVNDCLISMTGAFGGCIPVLS